MFEKEAEEKYCKGCKLRIEQCLWAWRNTNGLNEPNEKNCSCIKVPAYIAGVEFGYNKANEWHYCKDELPEELHDVLCFVIHNEHRYVLQGYLREGRWVLSPLGTYLNNDDVIAWKEIVLPKERA